MQRRGSRNPRDSSRPLRPVESDRKEKPPDQPHRKISDKAEDLQKQSNEEMTARDVHGDQTRKSNTRNDQEERAGGANPKNKLKD